MVPRADLQPRGTRDLEEEEEFGDDADDIKMRSSRSHQVDIFIKKTIFYLSGATFK